LEIELINVMLSGYICAQAAPFILISRCWCQGHAIKR